MPSQERFYDTCLIILSSDREISIKNSKLSRFGNIIVIMVMMFKRLCSFKILKNVKDDDMSYLMGKQLLIFSNDFKISLSRTKRKKERTFILLETNLQ